MTTPPTPLTASEALQSLETIAAALDEDAATLASDRPNQSRALHLQAATLRTASQTLQEALDQAPAEPFPVGSLVRVHSDADPDLNGTQCHVVGILGSGTSKLYVLGHLRPRRWPLHRWPRVQHLHHALSGQRLALIQPPTPTRDRER